MKEDSKIRKELQRFLFIDLMNDRYLSPDEINRRIPSDFKDEKLLDLILALRNRKFEPLYPLEDQQKQPFRYWKTPRMEKMLHEIDIPRAQWQETKQKSLLGELLVRSLIDEAYYSSWIEGAKTTRRRAEELVRKGDKPQDRSEQMCLNNFRTMDFIVKNLDRKLDEGFVCEVHRITTENTLDPEDEPFAGKYRDKQNYVVDESKQKVDYMPPPASDVSGMMQNLYNWVSFDVVDSFFVPPLVKASVIHFYTVYVHPFFDGNGRTARALMYHYLLKHGYEFMKFFSISKAIATKQRAYYQAILDVEKFDSDLTYFLLYSVQMILEAITTVETEKQMGESLANWLANLHDSGVELNPRQEKAFKLHFRQGLFPITIKKYQKINHVVYETARTDLLELCDKGLLQMEKKRREFVFNPIRVDSAKRAP